MGHIFNRKTSSAFRRSLRNNPTEPEHRLWQALRSEQLGVKFRRQHNIGVYVADFYSAEACLVVEVDGESHYADETARQHDVERDAYFAGLGLRVFRVTNAEVMANLDGVLQQILLMLRR